jgi:hypothetical protein
MMPHPEPEDREEEARLGAARVSAARVRMDALRGAAVARSYERAFLRREPATFGVFEFALLDRLLWHYRARLPGFLRPKLNPDDPIVGENDASRAA